MNPAVPGLGMGSLGLLLTPAREQWMMHWPVSSPQPRLCQAGRPLLVLGMNFISVSSLRACPAVFPWTSLSRDTPVDTPCGLGGRWCRGLAERAPGDVLHPVPVILRPSQTEHLPRAAACFSGDAFPLSLGFCNPRPPRAIYSPGFAVDLTSQPFPRAVPGQPDLPGCGRTKYFQHFLIRPKLVVFFAV